MLMRAGPTLNTNKVNSQVCENRMHIPKAEGQAKRKPNDKNATIISQRLVTEHTIRIETTHMQVNIHGSLQCLGAVILCVGRDV